MMTSKHQKTTVRKRRSLREFLAAPSVRTTLVVLVGTAVLCLLMAIAIAPKRYNLRVGEISHTTITATKDVVDEVSTARQREEAASKVEPSYVFSETVTGDVLANLETVLNQVNSVQQYGSTLLEQQYPGDPRGQAAYQFNEAELNYAKSQLTQLTLAGYQMQTLLHATDQQMQDMTDDVTAAVENILNTTIREGYVSDTIQYLQQIVGYKTDIDLLQNVVTPILRKVMQPNMLIDKTATEALREEARKTVEPVIYKQGQNIVLARERVTYNQLEMLRSLGLLDSDNVDIMMYVGAVIMVLTAVGVLLLALMQLRPEILHQPARMLIIMLALCLTLGVCVLAKLVNVYLMPTLLCVMMLTSLLGAREGLASCLCMTLLVGTLATGSESMFGTETVNMLITTIISSMAVLMVVRHKPNRQQILLCGIITGVLNAVLILIMGFMTNTSLHEVAADAIWSGASAAGAAILTIAFNTLVEVLFNLATPSKLMELSNPNHPLLRRLLIEASGTYHHSIIVANLAEAAAESVHGNQLLARAGAYFHDIGKLKRPLYFKENQLGDNPHEHTNPYVSAAIVTAHTRDGLVLAQQYRLPQEIQNIITEHHGDTPVMYFYHKASQQAGEAGVDIEDFRYDGHRPQTKEAAIIMLADTVEAAVRSMSNPTPQAIEEFIHKLVRGKLDDGQLDEAPLTLRDIERICQAFATVLKGVFHERIEYPSISPAAAARVNASMAAENRSESRVEAAELRRVDAEENAKAAPAPEAATQPKMAAQPAAASPKCAAQPKPAVVQPAGEAAACQPKPAQPAGEHPAQPKPAVVQPAGEAAACQPKPAQQQPAGEHPAQPKPAQPQPAAEPAVQPKPIQPQPAAESAVQPKPVQPQPIAEPAVQPKPVQPQPAAEPAAQPKPAQPQPAAEPAAQPKPVQPQPAAEPAVQPKPVQQQPAAEPAVQPKPAQPLLVHNPADEMSEATQGVKHED